VRRSREWLIGVTLIILFFSSAAFSIDRAPTQPIASRFATADGVKLHYLTSGHGPATVVLLHGYAETSRMWRPLIPLLAEKFTVIAPDLPGIGESDIPADGLDMKTAAIRVHSLVKSLGVAKARVVGHDIGLMVAYAYARPVSRGNRKARVDGRIPSWGRRMGDYLQ